MVRNIQANKITVSFLPWFVMAQAWWDKASQVIEIGSALVALQAEPFPCQDLGDPNSRGDDEGHGRGGSDPPDYSTPSTAPPRSISTPAKLKN